MKHFCNVASVAALGASAMFLLQGCSLAAGVMTAGSVVLAVIGNSVKEWHW